MVDDNQLTLPGFVQALEGSAEVEVVAGLNHDQALAWDGDWSSVDALVLDAADEGRPGNQFPGVAVVRHVRSAGAGPLISPASDVESFVTHVEAGGLAGTLSRTTRSRDQPRSRRWARFRRESAGTTGIAPVNATTGDSPRGQELPSIRQLSRLCQWAARIRRPE